MPTSEITEVLEQILHGFNKTFESTQQATQGQIAALKSALTQANSGGSGNYSTKPPHFKGDELDDVNDFIKSFDRFADFYNWSSEKRMRAMPLHFQGHDNIWFNSLAEGAYANYDQLQELLQNQFNSGASKWRLRQELNQRKQGTQESVVDYTADMRRQCQRLGLPKSEWLHIFIQGLRSDIKSHVVLQQPESFEEAENLAKLKEAVTKPEPSLSNVTQDLARAIAEQMRKPAVAAYISEPREKADQEVTNDNSLRRIIQQEIRQAFRDVRGTSYNGTNFSQRRQYQPATRQSGPTGPNGSFYRNRRTTDGVPICNSCGKRGHTSYNCWEKNPRRDPRLPNDSRFQSFNRPNQMPMRPRQGN